MNKWLSYILILLQITFASRIHAQSNDIVYQLIEETDQLWEDDRIEEAIQKINQTIPQIVKIFGKLSTEYVNPTLNWQLQN